MDSSTIKKKASVYLSRNEEDRSALINGLDYVNYKDIIKSDDVVFIKPNFTNPYYSQGVTTRPELLRTILEVLKDRSSRVIVGESNGGNRSFSAESAFQGHNMYNITKDCGAELVNLSKLEPSYITEKINEKNVKVQLPNILLSSIDSFVSVPVLKVHVMTGVSLGLKNLWGCYPDTMRCLCHKNLSEKLTLIAKNVKPRLVIIDGKYALDGHGPMWGHPKNLNTIIISDNIVSSDSIGANIMGIPLQKVNHILVAEKENLGNSDLKQINTNKDISLFQDNFIINKTLIDNLSTLLFEVELLATLVMNSPLTPLIYGIAKHLRSKDENKVVNSLKEYNF